MPRETRAKLHKSNFANIPYPVRLRRKRIKTQKIAKHIPQPLHIAEFTKFSSLPEEVRRMIWIQAITDTKPRIVDFFVKTPDDDTTELDMEIWHPRDQFPALLRVNWESRAIALEYYKMFLEEEGQYRMNAEKDVVRLLDTNILFIFDSWLDFLAKERPKDQRQLENKAECVIIEGQEIYPTLEELDDCSFYSLNRVMLQKPDKGLDSSQEEYLRALNWKHKPIKHNASRFVNCINNREIELSFLKQSDLESDKVSSPLLIT